MFFVVLNLPVGTVLHQLVALKTIDFKKFVLELMDTAFTGYVVVTAEGYVGIEEGVFIFKGGALSGAIYEYTNFDIPLFGDTALQQCFNAAAAEFAVMDVCELSKQQVELIIAFNERILLPQKILQQEAAKLFKKSYDFHFAEKALKELVKKEESKYDVFKKIGLPDISK